MLFTNSIYLASLGMFDYLILNWLPWIENLHFSYGLASLAFLATFFLFLVFKLFPFQYMSEYWVRGWAPLHYIHVFSRNSPVVNSGGYLNSAADRAVDFCILAPPAFNFDIILLIYARVWECAYDTLFLLLICFNTVGFLVVFWVAYT